MELGIRIPTGVRASGTPGPGPGRGQLAERARLVEELGFDSLWCMDHLLRADYGLGAATLDPLLVLPVLLGATTTVTVGTALLVVPLRDPLWLLKQLGTISALEGDRVILGLGAGWDEREFALARVPRSERRHRLDAVIEALASARAEGSLTFRGEPIEPAPTTLRGVYVGGGSSAVDREGTGSQELAPSVRARIAAADGWIARSTASAEQIGDDLRRITAVRRRPEPLRVLRSCFLFLSTATDHDRAVEEQLAAFRRAGWSGTRADLERSELVGTIAEVADRLSGFAGSGVSSTIVHPVADFDRQVALAATEVLPRIRPLGIDPVGTTEGKPGEDRE